MPPYPYRGCAFRCVVCRLRENRQPEVLVPVSQLLPFPCTPHRFSMLIDHVQNRMRRAKRPRNPYSIVSNEIYVSLARTSFDLLMYVRVTATTTPEYKERNRRLVHLHRSGADKYCAPSMPSDNNNKFPHFSLVYLLLLLLCRLVVVLCDPRWCNLLLHVVLTYSSCCSWGAHCVHELPESYEWITCNQDYDKRRHSFYLINKMFGMVREEV